MSALRKSIFLVVFGFAFLSGAARADINNFSFLGIDGVGSLSGRLSTRLGTTSNADKHVINIEDCQAYRGGQISVRVRIDPLPLGSYQYALAYAPPNKTCSTADTNPQATDGSCYVPAAQRELTSTSLKATIDLDKLIGSACDSQVQGDATFYVIIQNTSIADVQYQTIPFHIDLRAPNPPILDSLAGGDARLNAKWSDPDNGDDDVTYVLYYSDAPFGEDDLDAVDFKDQITARSVAIDNNVYNSVTYWVSVAARDSADNESVLSNQLEITPEPTTDFWMSYVNAGGEDVGSFCFVATAAYGSTLHNNLHTLRQFRDEILRGSTAGSAFVDAYYRYGRFAAAYIADKPALRAAARVALSPLVWLATAMVALGPALFFSLSALFGVGLFGLVRLARKTKPLSQEPR